MIRTVLLLAAPALIGAGPVGAGPTLPCLQEKCAVFVDTCLLVSGCDKVITCMDGCSDATCENLCFDDIAGVGVVARADIAVLSGCGGANGCFHYGMVQDVHPDRATMIKEQGRMQVLLNAWATTDSCNAAHFHGRCGVSAALIAPGVSESGPLLAQIAAGASPNPDASAVFNTKTLFEIASNTKVFTAVVLCRLIVEGLITMETTLGSLIPSGNIGPYLNPAVATITMQELVTHTSGLPKLPPNMNCSKISPPLDCSNPFTGYTESDLYDFLASDISLPTRGHFSYSNLGFGLLGHLLELRTNRSYDDLVKWTFLKPLGMKDTKIILSDSEWKDDVASGIDFAGKFAERRGPYGVLKGQGAYHSTVLDMATFLAANLNAGQANLASGQVKLAKALRMAAEPLAVDAYTVEHGQVASGWQLYSADGARTVWKYGDTEGYGSFMAWNSATGRAAVAMESCGDCGAVDGGAANKNYGGAVDQLVRLLVDEPRREMPIFAPPLPLETLGLYTGCFLLPATTDRLRQPKRDASVVTVSSLQGQVSVVVALQHSSSPSIFGSASLTPFSRPASPGIASMGFAFNPKDDTICLRPEGQGPLEEANIKFGRRELYYLSGEGNKTKLDTLVLHIDGWDLFASRVPCAAGAGHIDSVPQLV